MVIALVVAAVLVVLFLSTTLRIVAEYERLVLFRLGRCVGQRGPGPVFLIPFIDASPKTTRPSASTS